MGRIGNYLWQTGSFVTFQAETLPALDYSQNRREDGTTPTACNPGALIGSASDHPVCLMRSDPEQRSKFFPAGHGLRRTQVLFPISNELAVMGAFEAYEEERDAPDWLIAQFNATIALHADRQIYSRDSDFMYRMAHNERVMRGDEFLANQATVRPSEDD